MKKLLDKMTSFIKMVDNLVTSKFAAFSLIAGVIAMIAFMVYLAFWTNPVEQLVLLAVFGFCGLAMFVLGALSGLTMGSSSAASWIEVAQTREEAFQELIDLTTTDKSIGND